MLIKTKGIVFRVVKYGETSVICDVYTSERGLQSYIINSVRAKKPKFHAGLLQVMSLIDLVAYAKEEKTLNYIKELRADYVYQTIPFQILKSSVGLFMAELAQKTIKESEENQALFVFLYEIFIFLDKTTLPIINLHIWFAVQLTAYLGFMPDGLEDDVETYFFDLKNGLYTLAPPAHGVYLGTDQAKLLDTFLNTSLEDCHKIALNANERRAFIRSIIQYYQCHVANFTELKTFTVLQEVL